MVRRRRNVVFRADSGRNPGPGEPAHRYCARQSESRVLQHGGGSWDLQLERRQRDRFQLHFLLLGQTVAGALTLGTFAFLTGSFARSRSAIEQVLSSFQDISDEALYVKDLFDFFELEPSIQSRAGALVAPRPIRRGFEFRNVAFGYPGSERTVVRNLSCRLDAGEKIALIGENGAGKTTIVKLLSRLYDPVAGAILLDGVRLARV